MHRSCIRPVIAGSLAFASFAASATTEPARLQDLPLRYGHYHVDHVVNDDATSSVTHSWSMTVLKPQAVDWAKRASVGYSTSVQKAEVLEAYTLKADGRRIDVPKDNYQLNINTGREAGGPVFSDRSSTSVVFPDVAVGDTVHFRYRIVQSEPIFPGHFDTGETFSRQLAYDDVRISIDYPARLPVRYETREMTQTEPTADAGRHRVQWQWRNPQPLRDDRPRTNLFEPEKEVGYDFSTFPDHAAIAAAYGRRATPKAAVTDRVRTLAAEIVGSRQEPAAQARALYEWVATKITYGGNCVGVGAVVPRDLDFVIDNRMGDCKDHATLLQALLAARGIASRQALVNAGSTYTLPRIPRVSGVNHVISYIPSLKLFLDSTSDNTPFGSLPKGLRGKPVLMVDGPVAQMQLPVPAAALDQRLVSRLRIADDGSLSGTVEGHYKGDVAVGMREWARQLSQDSRATLVKEMLRGMGLNGDGRIDMEDPTELSDTYRVTLTLDKVEKFIRFPGNGAFHIAPFLGGATIQQLARPDTGEQIDRADTCSNGHSVEEYTIELPARIKVMALPDKLQLADGPQRYEAGYSVKGRVLHARRQFDDRTPTAVCSAEALRAEQRLSGLVYDNLKLQVLYVTR